MNKREIKFRVWDSEKKYMHFQEDRSIFPCVSIDLLGNILLIVSAENVKFEHHKNNDRFIPMQYIFLKDKNGKEIYEGDILYEKCWEREEYFKIEEIDRIGNEWGQEAVGWLIPVCCEDYEIIGNIYENPELLEKLNAK